MLTRVLVRRDDGERYDPLSGAVTRPGRLSGRMGLGVTQAMKLVTILFNDFGTFYIQTTSAVTVAIVFE